MRKPALTREQKKHAREQRAILRLRRAAVCYTLLMERTDTAHTDGPMAFAELGAACDAYTNTLTAREQRKLTGLLLKPEEINDLLEAGEHFHELMKDTLAKSNEAAAASVEQLKEATASVELQLSNGRTLVLRDDNPIVPSHRRKRGNS